MIMFRCRPTLFAATLAALALPAAAAVAPLAAQAAAAAPAAAAPNFSGKWTLDPDKGSGDMLSESATMTVTQDAKAIKVQSIATTAQMGNMAMTVASGLDGTPLSNPVSVQGMSLDMVSSAAWDGPVLVITTSASVQGMTYKQIDRWTLEKDGKTLTMSSDIDFGGQAMWRKQVYKKDA